MTNLSIVPDILKTCNKCKQMLPLSYYAKNSKCDDRLARHCKSCDKVKQEAVRKRNKKQVLDYSRSYRQRNKESFDYRLKALLNASKQRAKLKKLEHTLTFEQLKSIYPPDNKCPVFGTELKFGDAGFRDNSPSVDKIDPTKGYTLENVQILSWRANRLKVDASITELEMLLAFMKQGE